MSGLHLASKIYDQDGNICENIPRYIKAQYRQNFRNMSRHFFLGNQFGRRDDIINIIYLLIWFHSKRTLNEDQKLTYTAEEICMGSNKCFQPILEEAYTYKYEDEPRYGVLIFLLEQ